MYNQQSYHSAGYRGNQPGHDNYLRADSTRPSNFQAQAPSTGFSSTVTPVQSQYRGMQRSFQPTGYVQSVYGQGQQQQQYQPSQQMQVNQQYSGSPVQSQASYHTANYRGNQPGHDNYLRADSTQPSSFQNQSFQSQYQPQQTSMNFTSSAMQNQAQFQPQAMNQNQSTQQFHMAHYQGNQPGHDQYLRADSQQPNQVAQFGRGF